jgi:hypothetical protein
MPTDASPGTADLEESPGCRFPYIIVKNDTTHLECGPFY